WRHFRARAVFRYCDPQTQTIADDFDWALLGRMAMNPSMALVESFSRRRERLRRQPFRKQALDRRAQLVALASVTQVQLADEACRRRGHAFGGELSACLSFQLAENVLGVLGVDLGKRAQLGADVVVHHVGAEEAERGERARTRRDPDAPHPKLLGDRGGMHRA